MLILLLLYRVHVVSSTYACTNINKYRITFEKIALIQPFTVVFLFP